jgi:hypothetical protein
MRTTRGFRAERDVEELWEEAIRRVKEGIQDTLRSEKDHELFIAVKDCMLGFAMTMEVSFIRPVNLGVNRPSGVRFQYPISTCCNINTPGALYETIATAVGEVT